MEIYQELDELTFDQMQLVNHELQSIKIRLSKLIECFEEFKSEIYHQINKD